MCAPYWPAEVGKALNFDNYVIEMLESKEFEDYTQREFKLTKETVSVQHMLYFLTTIFVLFVSKHIVTLKQSSSITTPDGQNMALRAQALA